MADLNRNHTVWECHISDRSIDYALASLLCHYLSPNAYTRLVSVTLRSKLRSGGHFLIVEHSIGMNGHTDESIAAEILNLFPQEIRTLPSLPI